MGQPHVQIIVGSVREGRVSEPVAHWVARRFEEERGYPAEIVDLRDWALPAFDRNAAPKMGRYVTRLQRAWAATIARADAFVFVVPEYNHGYTGVLKNALDWIYAEWTEKPAAFVSFGNASGARAVQQLKQVLGELHMVPLEPMVALRPHGQIKDGRFPGSHEDEKRLSKALAELLRYQGALAPLKKPPAPPWAGRRVLVIGIDPAVNRSVVAPLVAAGLDAHGLVPRDGEVPNGEGFELVGIGRGAAGAKADAIKAAVRALDPAKPILDLIHTVAVRQVLAALDPDAPTLEVSSFELAEGKLTLHARGDAGRLGVTLFARTATGVEPHRIAELDLLDEVQLSTRTSLDVHSVVIDLDGAAFWHQPILNR